MRKTIAYLNHSYPVLTETFVYREVLGLRRRGLKVETYAVWKPDPEGLSVEARPLMEETTYVFPLNWPVYLARHLFALLGRPGRYLATLLFVISRPGIGFRERLLAFCHFCIGVHLAEVMRRRRVAHVHAHFTHTAAAIALVIHRLEGIPFSFTAHNLLFTGQALLRDKFREARFVVAISEYTRTFLTGFTRDAAVGDKIHVVHCGINTEDFSPRNHVPDGPVRLALVAQLAERKGVAVLVEACRILAGRGVPFRCDIFGDGPQKTALERQVEANGLAGLVRLNGVTFQERLRSLLAGVDLFVLPCVRARNGDMDGIPVSLMEAMAMEITPVSTRISGIPELIQDGHCGVLVEPGDAGALADAVQGLARDTDRRLKMGRMARQRVIEAFHIDRSVEALAALYRSYGS